MTIKLLAHALGASPALAGPFIEAARKVTEVRHPNLPVVHEVAHGGTDLYVVMDYMKGETVAALLRTLQQRGESLDFTLAAHIVARAAAGLNAAHEQGVLHEQLTPHDVFIGYDGSVRVLDVGIAAARSRALGELGTRAKLVLQYSSPERCRGETIDAQSDVFSLGALLWELETGLPLFERAKEADTVKAICEEPMVPPSIAFRGLPEQLSRITMQALERLPVKRFRSAKALEEALDRSVGLLGMGSPEVHLAGLMRSLFEARIAAKDEMMVRILAGKEIDDLDVGEPAEDRVSPRVTGRPPSAAAPLAAAPLEEGPAAAEPEVAAPELVSSAPSLSRRRTIVGVGAAIVAIALVAVGLAATSSGGGRTIATTVGAASSAPPVVSASPSTLVSAPVTATASVVSSAAALSSASTDEIETPVTAATAGANETIIHIETVPPKAIVLVGTEKRGVTPMDLKLPKGTTPVVVELRHPGYQTLREKVVPDQSAKLRLTLAPAPHAGGAAAGTGAATATAPYHKFQ
ncbi:MAG: protein kinase [Deltaproteobacteria bacterium]|nr:protein kinase [Deltaproteobacteria bacterium]